MWSPGLGDFPRQVPTLPTVVGVDSRPVARPSLARLLRASGMKPVAVVGSLEEVPWDQAPDLAVLSLPPGAAGWLEGIAEARARAPGCRILALSTQDGPEAGAVLLPYVDGVVVDPTPRRLARAATWVLQGHRYFEGVLPGAWTSSARGPEHCPLTAPQRRLLGLLSEGLSDADIAGQLGCSVVATKARVRGVLQAVGALNRAEAVAKALRKGWIECGRPPPSPPRSLKRVAAGKLQTWGARRRAPAAG